MAMVRTVQPKFKVGGSVIVEDRLNADCGLKAVVVDVRVYGRKVDAVAVIYTVHVPSGRGDGFVSSVVREKSLSEAA
jgi:hypothetical protein